MWRLGGGRLAIAFSIGVLANLSAQACDLTLSGNQLWLRGHIVAGDQFKFRDIIGQAGPGRVSAVYLDSPGGDIYSAGEIARQIRNAGLSTVVDASRYVCASSCTIVFVGGVRRFYRNAKSTGGISSGKGFRGLGFHEGANSGEFGPGSFSEMATGLMVSLYHELGVPKAATLVDFAPPEAIYGLSGAMAMKLGIATDR